MGEPALAAELLDMLLRQLDALPGELAARAPDDRPALGHKLAGAAANLGARRLERAALALAGAAGAGIGPAEEALLAEASALAALLRAEGAGAQAVDGSGADP